MPQKATASQHCALFSEARLLAPGSRWLFSNQYGTQPIGADAAIKPVARSSEALRLDDFKAHDLRRTAASHMAMLEVSPHPISLNSNHASARKGTAMSTVHIRYSYNREKREAMEKWGRKHQGLVVGK